MTENTQNTKIKKSNEKNWYDKFVDSFAGKVYSRKLMVWVVATASFFLGYINYETWQYISIVYIATQGALDFGKIVYEDKNKKEE